MSIAGRTVLLYTVIAQSLVMLALLALLAVLRSRAKPFQRQALGSALPLLRGSGRPHREQAARLSGSRPAEAPSDTRRGGERWRWRWRRPHAMAGLKCKDGKRNSAESDWTCLALEGHPFGVFLATSVDHLTLSIREASPAFWKLVGWEPGSAAVPLGGPETDSRDMDRVEHAVRQRTPVELDVMLYRKDERGFWAELWLNPIAAGAGSIAWIGILRDVTEARRVEREMHRYARELKQRTQELSAELAALQTAADQKTRLCATLSQDIRTPVNSVIAVADLLAETALDAEQRRCVALVRSAGDNMLGLLNEVALFSSPREGELRLDNVLFALRPVVQEALSQLALKARSKGLEVQMQFDADLPQTVCGDPVRLKQVLHHLVTNAIKFTDAGHVHVSVAPEPESSRALLRFEISDTGIGIPENQRSALLGRSGARNPAGRGRGLTIASQIVETMGGRLGCDSVPGSGTTFWFTASLRSEPELCEKLESGDDERPSRRILVVEDNDVNRRIALRLLERSGYAAKAVPDGRAAVDEVGRNQYDLILMDVQMPEMDGFAATRAIRGLESTVRDVPVIAMTANTMSGERERCLRAGMNDYLSKPVTGAVLRTAIEKWLHTPVSTLNA